MTTSFYNGIGGVKLSQTGVDVLGSNIANINTVGYKQQEVSYSSVFSGMLASSLNSDVTSDIGMISTATSTTMNLSQGSLSQTDNVFDIALSGKGWMAVSDDEGLTKYTRTGSFSRDATGTLVTQTGEKLLVANAQNLTFNGSNWEYNSAIPTDNLVQTKPLSSIQLPDNIIFPAQDTTQVKIGGNLPNENIAPTPKPAVLDSDFGVLYNRDGVDMSIKSGQDLIFGFGDNVRAEDGLVKYEFCVADDEEDGEDVNVDFYVNGEEISVSVADGSDAKTIVDAIADVLDDKDIAYDKTDNSITLKDKNKLYVEENGGDVVLKNGAIERLVYNSKDNTANNFTTIQDFLDDIGNLANIAYQDKASVGLDSQGKLFIQNNTDDTEITSLIANGDENNDMLIENLGTLGSIIKPNTASNSLEFNRNYQGFTGDIIKNGNKNDLKFDFYKTKIDGENTTWNLTITEYDENNQPINSQNLDLVFDKNGGLITPDNIKFDGINIDLGGGFSGITDIAKANVGFNYEKDGLLEGYLKNYDVDDNGNIIATFSNNQEGILGQIPLFHFQNEQGLDSLGQNLYTPTDNSGEAFLYENDNGEYLSGAVIKNYSLEMSNVDMGKAMTELIVMQKSFDANSKSITTSDQMIQKAIDMKR